MLDSLPVGWYHRRARSMPSDTSPRDPSARPDESFWRSLWLRPDALLSDAGASGETLVAAVRLLVLVVLLYLPVRSYLDPLGLGFGRSDLRAGLALAGAALLSALLVYSAVQRNWGRSWIGFVSSNLDVSLVSAILVWYLAVGRPLDALQNPVVFPAYFLAIGATTLRYNPLVCLVTGTLATLQYGGLLAFASWRWELADPAVAGASRFGAFAWDTQVAHLIALVVATAIATTTVVRVRRLRMLSAQDRFTGLLNRTTFDERLAATVDSVRNLGGGFAVAMIDIDHFKRFNDSYGHAGGDEALRQVSQILRRSFRDSDAVARYGGEEFCVLLPGVSAAQARPLLERIRRTVEGQAIPLANGTSASITVSIGVALWPEDGNDSATMLASADERLYAAKAAGRNRVVAPL